MVVQNFQKLRDAIGRLDPLEYPFEPIGEEEVQAIRERFLEIGQFIPDCYLETIRIVGNNTDVWNNIIGVFLYVEPDTHFTDFIKRVSNYPGSDDHIYPSFLKNMVHFGMNGVATYYFFLSDKDELDPLVYFWGEDGIFVQSKLTFTGLLTCYLK
jgi:hypothetical protein